MLVNILNKLKDYIIIICLIGGFIVGLFIGLMINKSPKVEIITPDTTAVETADPAETDLTIETKEPEIDEEVVEYGEALRQAKSSIAATSWSYSKLKEYLITYHSYSPEAAEYACENCGADWKAEAIEKAKGYISYDKEKYSDYEALKDQMEYEKFTEDEIEHALNEVGLKAE